MNATERRLVAAMLLRRGQTTAKVARIAGVTTTEAREALEGMRENRWVLAISDGRWLLTHYGWTVFVERRAA